MDRSVKRRAAAGLVIAVAAGGTGAAMAATGGHGHARATVGAGVFVSSHAARGGGIHSEAPEGRHGPSDELRAAATYLGLTVAQLQTQLQGGKTLAQVAAATPDKTTGGLVGALVAAEKIELAAAVTAGRLTQAQADAIAGTLTQRFTDLANGVRPADHRGGPGHLGGGDDFDAAATYLGLTPTQLQTQLQGGKTLAQVAAATPDKTTAGLIQALVAAEKTELDAKVVAGKLTAAQEQTLLPMLEQRFTALVNGQRGVHGPEGHSGFRSRAAAPGSNA
jgi:hypothetical protein